MLALKISAFCFRIFTGKLLFWVALRVLSFFVSLNASSALTHENSNVHPLSTLLIAMVLQCLSYLKIAFNIGWDRFSLKGLTSSNFAIFRFLTVFKKKALKFSTIVALFVKILSLSMGVIFSEDFALPEKRP